MVMKHKTYILTLIVLMVTAYGCSDYLGLKPRGYDVAEKLDHYEGLLYGSESFMLDEVFPFMSFEWTTDADAYANAYSLMGSDITNAYKWQADIFRPDENCGEWNFPASMLYPINIVANEVMSAEGGTEEEKKAILSEARVMRAYMTFFMAQCFGAPYDPATAGTDLCVPIITKASTTGNEFPRRTVKDVYDFIITEMTGSVPELPERPEHFSRAFRVTGQAMLGKVYWMMGDYESALEPLGKAMTGLNAAGCGFLDYNSMEENGEIAYPSDDLLNPELIYNIKSMANIWPSMYPSYYGTILFALKTDILKRYYKANDLRLCFISGLSSGKTAFNRFDRNDTYYLNLSNFVANFGISVPDLYLMYAECLARTGSGADARTVLEEMRRNRMPSSEASVTAADGDDLIRFVLEERFREFIGYGNLWFDMRRLWEDPLFQDLKEMYTHTDGTSTYTLTKERLTMRIPPAIMEWHPEYTDNK